MNCVNHLVTESLPGYLKGLPIPNTVGGWFSLSVRDWARLVPFGVAVGGLSYLSLQGLADSPVVGSFLREKLAMLPGMQAVEAVEEQEEKEMEAWVGRTGRGRSPQIFPSAHRLCKADHCSSNGLRPN